MLRRLRKGLRLPVGERGLLVQACAGFVVLEFLLRVISFPRLLAVRSSPTATRVANDRRPIPAIERFVWIAEAAARCVISDPTCLKKALVAFWLLRRHGVATTLCIGVARRGGELAAHAWLERNGEVILGAPEHEAYERLFRWDGIGAR